MNNQNRISMNSENQRGEYSPYMISTSPVLLDKPALIKDDSIQRVGFGGLGPNQLILIDSQDNPNAFKHANEYIKT